MIHLFRQPHHILTTPHPDQLFHDVIKSRMIEPLKASQQSNTLQIHEKEGGFVLI